MPIRGLRWIHLSFYLKIYSWLTEAAMLSILLWPPILNSSAIARLLVKLVVMTRWKIPKSDDLYLVGNSRGSNSNEWNRLHRIFCQWAKLSNLAFSCDTFRHTCLSFFSLDLCFDCRCSIGPRIPFHIPLHGRIRAPRFPGLKRLAYLILVFWRRSFYYSKAF